MNLHGEIITVRPDVPIETIQKLPNYVGISEKTAGATGISMNIVVIPPSAKAQPHYHEGFETARKRIVLACYFGILNKLEFYDTLLRIKGLKRPILVRYSQ
jgi:uncharacterized RmlC-like cupin family protein